MPARNSTKKSSNSEEQTTSSASSSNDKKVQKKQTTSTESSAPAPKVETTKKEKVTTKKVEKVPEIVEEDNSPEPTETKRGAFTREMFYSKFDEILSSIEKEVEQLRENAGKNKGIKFLRSLGKELRTLKNRSTKLIKSKERTTRTSSDNSGFKKPVPITKELAQFCGFTEGDLHSRVDVTKYMCKYVKDNNLQNPEYKREIIPDKKLTKLLGYDSAKDENKLTFSRLQYYLKNHYVKNN